MDSQSAHDLILSNPEVRKIRQRTFLRRETAKNVAKLRVSLGLTQSQLAEMLGTQQSSIARLEKGEKIPSLEFLNRIAEAVGDQLLPPQFASQITALVSPAENNSQNHLFDLPKFNEPEKVRNFKLDSELDEQKTIRFQTSVEMAR